MPRSPTVHAHQEIITLVYISKEFACNVAENWRLFEIKRISKSIQLMCTVYSMFTYYNLSNTKLLFHISKTKPMWHHSGETHCSNG